MINVSAFLQSYANKLNKFQQKKNSTLNYEFLIDVCKYWRPYQTCANGF